MSEDFDRPGYGRPPKHSQFKSGQSGNPNGRPKGTKNFRADLLAELSETMPIRENGAALQVTKQRAIVKLLVSTALNGEPKTLSLLVSLLARELNDNSQEDASSETEQTILEAYIENEVARRIAQKSSSSKSQPKK